MSHSLVNILLIAEQFFHGFALCLLSFLTVRYIFGAKTESFAAVSLGGGAIFSALFFAAFTAKIAIASLIPELICLLYMIITSRLIPACRTAVMPLIFAFVFSRSAISIFSTFVFSVTRAAGLFELTRFAEIISFMLIYSAAILYVLLLSLVSRQKEREELSAANMFFISGTSAIISEVMLNTYVTSETVSEISPEAAVPVLVSFMFIAAFVIMSVKTTQARYLARMNSLNEEFLDAQAKHFEKMKENDLRIRRINHDMKNHFICLNKLLRDGNYEELGEYIGRLTDEVAAVQSTVRTGNEIVDAILTEKSERAGERGITFLIDGNFSVTGLAPMDLCTIIANLTDNAVEAVSASGKGGEIKISCRRTANFSVITVSNHTAEPVDTSGAIKTTKHDREAHGLGTENVKRAAKKYSGEAVFNCESAENDYIFTAEVMIPLNV